MGAMHAAGSTRTVAADNMHVSTSLHNISLLEHTSGNTTHHTLPCNPA